MSQALSEGTECSADMSHAMYALTVAPSDEAECVTAHMMTKLTVSEVHARSSNPRPHKSQVHACCVLANTQMANNDIQTDKAKCTGWFRCRSSLPGQAQAMGTEIVYAPLLIELQRITQTGHAVCTSQ